MIQLMPLLNEGIKEKSAEYFIKDSIKGTEWENKVFLAGGAVRDNILGISAKDIDLVIDMENGGIEFSNWITKKYNLHPPVVYPTYGTAKFNLNGVVYNNVDLTGFEIEAVMPRSEKYTAGSRKPEVGAASLKADAERRDINFNTLFKNLSTGEILDLTGKGISDLKNKIIRTPLDPDITFKDDPLRMLRVCRFYAKYKYNIPLYILKAIKRNAHELKNISNERIRDELNKMLVTSSPQKVIKLLKVTTLLHHVIPELIPAIRMTQNIHHKHDVFDHTLDVLSKTQPELVRRLMALFHDIGKTVTRSVSPTGVHFYGHEDESAKIAREVMTRLRYPTELIDAVSTGAANHMRLKHGGDTAVGITDKTLRKFVNAVGTQLEAVLDVIHADNICHSESSSMPNQINNVRLRLQNLTGGISKPRLPITGKDLIDLGFIPGPIFTTIMSAITEAWFENPNLTREEALSIAKSIKS